MSVKNFVVGISVNMAANFAVGEQIGRGQYGQVYRGTCEGSYVAIKRVLIEGGDREYEEMKKLNLNLLKTVRRGREPVHQLLILSRRSLTSGAAERLRGLKQTFLQG